MAVTILCGKSPVINNATLTPSTKKNHTAHVPRAFAFSRAHDPTAQTHRKRFLEY